jgi:hypothetical protein
MTYAWAVYLARVWLHIDVITEDPHVFRGRNAWHLSGWDPHVISRSLPRAEIHAGLHVKCLLFLSYFKQNWNVSTNFSKLPNLKFHENP